MALSKSPKFSPTLYKALLLTVMSMAFVIPLLGVMLPYMEFFNGMAVQPKLKAQGLYGWGYGVDLPGTLTPPAGTVSRAGYVRHPFAGADTKNADTYATVLEQAGEYFRNPVTPTLEVLQRGRTLFTIYCGVCHGSEALGDGPVVGPDRFPAPPSLHTDVARAYRDGTLFQIITAGKANMSSYANELEPKDRWAVIYYVRALQRSLHPKPEDLER
jgi:mono/diheme cytochrome c family protein